jgi:endo-1,4-beta-D-glucanase Y
LILSNIYIIIQNILIKKENCLPSVLAKAGPSRFRVRQWTQAGKPLLGTGRMQSMMAYWFLAAVVFSAGATAAPTAEWANFKQRFIEPDGRVVDTGQGNISHSEGQGYAMLLAVHYDDRASFEHIWQWTQKNLQVRGDNLLAWRWTPQAGISDRNNASDGDLLVAWALLRASYHWHASGYLQASQKITRAIREKLLRKTPQGLVLLPGLDGFDKPAGITVNLSYWIFPALDEIGQADPAPEWNALSKTGMDILQYARFGRWGLPPDWLILTEKVAPSDGISNQFGYNAVRIPLYLLWSRRESPALLKPYREFWGYFKGAEFLPSWTNLKDDCVDSYDASAGIHQLAQWALDPSHPPAAQQYHPGKDEGYYSSTLLLLVDMAISERGLGK